MIVVLLLFLCRSQSSEDKIGEEVTKSLKRMLETMRSEVERSSSNISTATSTTKNLKSTTDNYEKLSGTIDESRGLIRDLWKRNRNDMIYIFGALGIFVATVSYVIVQRSPGVMWLPGKMVARQLSNLSRYSSYMIPKSREIVEMITEMTEAALSDTEEYDEPPRMFIDSIKKMEEEYGSDELLKEAEGEVSGSIEQENVDERVSESEKAANVKSEDPVIEAKGPENQFGNPETVEESVLEEIVAEPSIEVDATKVAEESIHSETTDVPVEESVITETVESFETVSVESIEAGISTSETLPLVTTTEPTIEINPEVPTEVTEPIQSTENADFIATSTEIPSDPEIVNIIEKTENEAIIIPPTVVTTVEEPSLIVTPFESTFIPIPTPAIHDTLSYYSASATDTDTSKDYSSEAELFSLEL